MTRHRLVLAAGLAAGLASPLLAQQSLVLVSQNGSFDPDGWSLAPFPTVGAARDLAADLRSQGLGGTRVGIYSGNYPETLTLDDACEFAAFDGPVVIGDLGQASTTFTLASYNAHLYGDALPESVLDPIVGVSFPFIGVLLADPIHWQENLRTQYISQRLIESDVDLVAYQELWSTALYDDLRARGAGHFDQSYYGSFVDLQNLPDCIPVPAGLFPTLCWEPLLNSGLAVFSKHPMIYAAQGVFTAETGAEDFFEPFATKGYTLTEISKDGFIIGVFNTHAQAGSEFVNDTFFTRQAQMGQLAANVRAYREAHPSRPVFVVGDFNIRGSGDPSAEYTRTLKTLFGENSALGMVDAARADYANRADNGVTSAGANRLAQHFDQTHSTDKRLDYVLYAPASLDGTTRVVLDWVDTKQHRAPGPMSEDGFSTVELSDHWAVHAGFRIVRD